MEELSLFMQLAWTFFLVGAFTFGGGYAMLSLIQGQVVVAHGWISESTFTDIVAISQMTPGPIGINAATFAGMKVAGFGGAVSATLGFCTPSLLLGILLAKLFFKYGDIGPIRGVLNGLRPAVVALIVAAGLSFIVLALWDTPKAGPLNRIDPRGVILLILAVAAVRRKVSVIHVLLGSGLLGLVLGMM